MAGIMSSEKTIMPIGKYKGQPLEAVRHDAKYFDWLCQQSWFREKYGDTYQIIINNFQEPTETPEHNKLQAIFLENEFLYKILTCFFKNKSFYNTENMVNFVDILDKNIGDIDKRKEFVSLFNMNIADKKNKVPPEYVKCDFEEYGFDVVITYKFQDHLVKFSFDDKWINGWYSEGYWNFYDKLREFSKDYEEKRIAFEIKPYLSDDYPAVLRQVKNNTSIKCDKVLIYDKFSAKGVSLEDVKMIFASSGVYVLSFANILGHEVL